MSLSRGLYGEKKEVLHLQADATSLADLKAETVRKKAEAVKNRQQGNYRPEKSGENKKKANIWSKENTGLLARMQRDMEVKAEEERNWAKSKSIMERKSKLYDSLKTGKGKSEVASNFLVNFSDRRDSDSDSDDGRYRSKDYPASKDGEEWVEYTDPLGRTRTCMKKDLKRVQRKNKDIVRSDEDDNSDDDRHERTRPVNSDDEPDLLSEDMRRDMLRQKWEKEEMENLSKDSLHYTDVRFDEARNHGAGFYAFSKDGDKRAQEQVTLKKLHEETDEARKEKERKAVKRKREMAERIRKIKQKRREKLGLPPLEDEEAEEDKLEEDTDPDFTKSVMEGLKKFREKNEEEERRRNDVRRKESLREWDEGKEGMGEVRKEWKVMTQQEWLDKQRKERQNEFAPPSAYTEARTILQKKEEEFIKLQEEKRRMTKSKPKENTFFKPPPPYERLAVPKPIPSLDPMAMLESTPTFTESKSDTRSTFSEVNSGTTPGISGIEHPMNSYSTAMRLDLHKKMQNQQFLPRPGLNTAIINELEEFEESDEEEDEGLRRGQKAEVAPPSSMDYYSFSGGPRDNKHGFRTHEDMASAFNQGLNNARKN